MPKYTVEDVLEIISSFSCEEKSTLKAQLNTVLSVTPIPTTTQQSRSMTVGGNFQVSGSGATVDMSQRQVIGSDGTKVRDDLPTTTQDLLQALEALHQEVLKSSQLNTIEKATAKVPIATAAAELRKAQPDKSLVDQSVAALKKGLVGVETLAEPVMRVATLVAKAWVML